MMNKITVIIPVYNSKDRLERCLESVVNQTFKELDIILINDGSEDSSIEIINFYSKKYKNILVVDRENRGVSYSRNEGISLSKTPYIAFLDSDDYIELDMYEKMYEAITKAKADVVVCGMKHITKDGYFLQKYFDKKTNINKEPQMIYELDYGPCNKLFKRKLWNNIRFPLNTKYEDLEAVLKVFLKSKNIVFISKVLYNYVYSNNGETGTIDSRVYDIFKVFDNLKDNFKGKTYIYYRELVVSKLFVYTLLVSKAKCDFSVDFLNSVYNYLNTNFDHWKLKYIMNSKNFKNFFMRFLQINKRIYLLYIRKRMY
ncbi:MAG: glycosyltransferase family 2 protein [bacterium]|nr:glycosyltransferase family 2 protein [bacterium]MDY4108703.1 glycosyltransferase family 2 protein [Bacilli bacterium]